MSYTSNKRPKSDGANLLVTILLSLGLIWLCITGLIAVSQALEDTSSELPEYVASQVPQSFTGKIRYRFRRIYTGADLSRTPSGHALTPDVKSLPAYGTAGTHSFSLVAPYVSQNYTSGARSNGNSHAEFRTSGYNAQLHRASSATVSSVGGSYGTNGLYTTTSSPTHETSSATLTSVNAPAFLAYNTTLPAAKVEAPAEQDQPIRRAFDLGGDVGQDQDSPIGDATLPFMLCLLAFSFYIFRQQLTINKQ